MDFEKKYLLGIRSIIIAMMIVAFTSIFMMERMSHAIKLILDENVYSLEASEDMLRAVGLASISQLDLYQEQFMDAMQRAKNNVTLPGESALIDRIERLAPMSFAGQENALQEIIEEISKLANLNREAMIKADENARFLSIAGGWAVVGLTLICFLFSRRLLHQVRMQTIAPIVEVCRGLIDWEMGNRLRRFQTAKSSKDIRRAQQTLNSILDRLS